VGQYFDKNGSRRAFLYSLGRVIDLGTLGGSTSGASRINDLGQVVGWSEKNTSWYDTSGTAWPERHAFLYRNGRLEDLGALGGSSSEACDINAQGLIVGVSSTKDGGPHAFLYENGVMRDLNSLITPGSGWILTRAGGVNSLGQIVGQGVHKGETHAFLLTPTGN
jgi:probable HAF family extracellular repeat protein